MLRMREKLSHGATFQKKTKRIGRNKQIPRRMAARDDKKMFFLDSETPLGQKISFLRQAKGKDKKDSRAVWIQYVPDPSGPDSSSKSSCIG